MKVTIITVCLNSAKTIEQTIQSVINQTYKNIEYIIVDGKSIDKTIRIIKKYKRSIACWISEPDEGLYDAMNKGIKLATGDIIGIINSDDWYELDAVEKVVGYFEKESCEMTYGDLTFVYSDQRKERASAKNVCLDDMKYGNVLWHPTVFVKRSLYILYGAYRLAYKIYSDYDFLLRMYYKGYRALYVPYNIAFFRVNGLHSNMPRRMILEEKRIAIENLLKQTDINQKPIRKIIDENYKIKRANMINSYILKRIVNYGKAAYCIKIILRKYFGRISCVSIFGAGREGLKCYNILRKSSINVKQFIDNSPLKWNKKYKGISIVSPHNLNVFEESNCIVISIEKYGYEVHSQLDKIGFKYKRDFIYAQDLKNEMISLYIKTIIHGENRYALLRNG